MNNLEGNYALQSAIRSSGLNNKKWFKVLLGIIAIFLAIYKFLLPKLDYQKYETVLIYIPITFIFFLLGFVIYFANEKKDENKTKALLRAILLPLGFIFLLGLTILFGIYVAPLLV